MRINSSKILWAATASFLLTVAGTAARAQGCPADGSCTFDSCRTPAKAPDEALWGELEPGTPGTYPATRDNTDFDQGGSFERHPYWFSLDVEEGYVFTVAGLRFQIWNANSKPEDPARVYDAGFTSLNLNWSPDAHAFSVFEDIDAPPGNSDTVALVGLFGMGMAMYDTSSKDKPQLKYQDTGVSRNANEVYAARIGSRDYAFVAATSSGGVFAYDMTAAMALNLPCSESQPGNPSPCSGVYLGQVGTRATARTVDGAGNFLALASGSSARGFEIWNVANPSRPVQVMTGLTSTSIHEVALWQEGSRYYLALRTSLDGSIYDVSCIAGGSCTLGSALWTKSFGSSGGTVTSSLSDGIPFLYWGSKGDCQGGDQREFLYDVSSPANPRDITPPGTKVVNGEAVSYWGWFYRRNGVHGFNRVAPRMGKFSGQYFYRAAYSVFDVHRRTSGSAPVPDFTYSPTEIYPNTAVNFVDASSGNPTSWDWSFQDGSPASSPLQSPSGVTFGTVGDKSVILDATNIQGTGTETKTVPVLDPSPVVASVSRSPNQPKLCQPITFTAEGVTGEPALTYSWEVKVSGSAAIATGGNLNPFEWTSLPATATAPTYVGEVTVTNASGTTTVASSGFTLDPLADLPAADTFAPTYPGAPAGPPTGTVAFSVDVEGATEWNWNFGDDPTGGPANDGYQGWTADPIDGPAPTHSYDQLGTFEVRVRVRNCAEPERESSPVSVTITSIVQLEARFASAGLFCGGGGCSANVNQAITFNDTSTGPPTSWDYDWDGNGDYEDPGNSAPVTSHAYARTGTFRPVLKVNRGGASDVFQHSVPIIVGVAAPPPSPPRITVSGATSGQTGQNLSYSASASNCTPSSTGWTWTVSGGTFNGSSNRSTVSISWASSGNKTVTARNSSCGSASGNRSVNISTSGGGGGGGTLNANFSFSPTSPAVGQAISFDAGSSTGGPGSFTWRDFGDGSPVSSGRTTTHTYSQAGQYRVILEVAKTADPSCPPFNICTDEVTKTVTVGGGGSAITLTGAATGTPNQALTFNASASGCTASGTGWTWTTSGGTINGSATGASVSITWPTTGTKAVTAKNSACGTAVGTRNVTISNGGGSLTAAFTFSPANPQPGQEVSFDAGSSTGSPGSFTWTTFGDGTSLASGQQVSHTYSQAGQYQVTLEVARNDDPSCPPRNICTDNVTKVVTVGGSTTPPPDAGFSVNVTCETVEDEETCTVSEGQSVQFTDTSTGSVSSRAWNFGDGSTGTAAVLSHDWDTEGTYTVTFTANGPGGQDQATKRFEVQAEPPPPADARILIPWASKSDGALDQLTSLYVHNPDSETRTVTVRFHLRRAVADTTPPRVHTMSLEPGATASFPDVLADPFGLNNVTGFLDFEAEAGAIPPVVVAFHKTFLADGTSFGQVVPAIAVADLPRAAAGSQQVLHLVGLNDNNDRLAFFGITNPNESVARFRLRFFNSLGEEIGTPPAQMSVGPLNLQQNQVERIRGVYGLSNLSDYRVQLEMVSEDPVYLYGANLRLKTLDPAFLRQGTTGAQRVLLVGTLAAEGLNNALWRTDSLLVNASDEVVETEISYTSVGPGATPLTPANVVLQPRETFRLVNVLQDRWGLGGTGDLGFLSFRAVRGSLPLIQAESYDIANPLGRFGQFIPPLHDSSLAAAGERQILGGLQQDADFRTTLWLLNTHATSSGEYTLIFRDLAGQEVGRIASYRVPPGNMRQLGPGQLPLVDGVQAEGFTVQIIVRQGELVSAGQVVDNATNDPKFVVGQTR